MNNKNPAPERGDYYRRIGADNLAPLWERTAADEPASPAVPAIWHYSRTRAHVMESGALISEKEAHRRVLVLENPALRGEMRITRSLYAGLQLILPGEVAPNHRHSQSALRFVIEGEGAYSAVSGEKTWLHPGDFVVTPSWAWHDHGNQGDGPVIWMDALDSPLVAFLDAEFREHAPEDMQFLERPDDDSAARYGAAMLPVDFAPEHLASPILNYSYARTRDALEAMRRAEQWDPCHGIKMRYADPASGAFAMPTIGVFMQLLPSGFVTAPYRSTDGTVICVVEGNGRTEIGDQVFTWGPHDIFVVPSWRRHRHRVDDGADAVLFSFSDRPVQQKLGLWREQRLDGLENVPSAGGKA